METVAERLGLRNLKAIFQQDDTQRYHVNTWLDVPIIKYDCLSLRC